MKVYVDELPKSCRDCPCMESDGYGFYTCLLYYKKHEMLLDCEDYKEDSRPNECLLQSLSDYTKQVRKEVVQEIRKKLPDFIYNFQEPETPRTKVVELEDIKYILDQIQGEP